MYATEKNSKVLVGTMSKLDEISLYEEQLQVVIHLLIIQIYSASYTLVFVYLGDFLKIVQITKLFVMGNLLTSR